MKRQRIFLSATCVCASVLILLLTVFNPAGHTAYAATGDWPGYLFDDGHTGFNGSETVINPTTAPKLKLKWTHSSGGAATPEPVVANNTVYWGSWDGFEHATDLNGNRVWSTNLGTNSDNNCSPPQVGVASTATVATVPISGTNTSVVFVGGGNARFYAINAANGHIIWSTSLGSPPAVFLWSSPEVYNGSVYEGVASFGDCPLIQGQLVQMNASTGAIQHIFDVVPSGCVGAGVWTSPTIDTAAGTVYISTGNGGSCSTTEKYVISLIELKVTDLSFITSWQLPASQQISDGDFGATPTLFTTSTGTSMVGLENKNGKYYAFKRSSISSGPVWTATVATSRGSISSSSFDGHTLYVGGNGITINGTSCMGSARALNPDTGALIWQHCLKDGTVVPAIVTVPGLVIVEQGTYMMILSASTGATLFRYQDSAGLRFDGPASVSNGVLYIGNGDGNLYAFAP